MGMYYFGLAFSLLIVILCVIATISIILEEDKPDPVITIPVGFGIVFSVIFVSLVIDYDNTVAIKADQFFLTRKDAYSCEKELYSCKLQIQEWQKDSVYWQHKIDYILKEK
jgi:hypothetical protein